MVIKLINLSFMLVFLGMYISIDTKTMKRLHQKENFFSFFLKPSSHKASPGSVLSILKFHFSKTSITLKPYRL